MPEKDPYEPVRVKDKDTGHELTIRRAALPHGNYEELSGDAVDPVSELFLPPKHGKAPKSAAASTAKEA